MTKMMAGATMLAIIGMTLTGLAGPAAAEKAVCLGDWQTNWVQCVTNCVDTTVDESASSASERSTSSTYGHCILGDGDGGGGGPSDSIQICQRPDGTSATVVPVTEQVNGNGNGNWFQFLQEGPGLGGPSNLYASWSMATNTLTNGADGFLWGAEYETWEVYGVQNSHLSHYRGATCEYLNASVDSGSEYLVNGGAWGTTSDWACSVTESWEFSIGIQISVADAGVTSDFSFGESKTCGNGGAYDSEVLFNDHGFLTDLWPV